MDNTNINYEGYPQQEQYTEGMEQYDQQQQQAQQYQDIPQQQQVVSPPLEEDDEFGGPAGAFANVGQGLVGKYKNMMMQYWQETINSIEHDDHDFKNHQLPLARIKKVMKTDEEVKMISAEAPILFAKGCDIFITELTMRAWIHAEENKRRTLQKSDIAAALQKSDMFDFLIDIVPREEEKPKRKSHTPMPTQMQQGYPGIDQQTYEQQQWAQYQQQQAQQQTENDYLLQQQQAQQQQQQYLAYQQQQQQAQQQQEQQPQQPKADETYNY
ncbi:unnamed protein product [Ambrosiozyma monospora]|uniref:Unnamed protein product n=1 Tax=Ambrosiozyma monospora TaxID=43982 RepID=A0ACB5T0R6_AMBMO|nr:unnamed protein product [Ambrosiozyma monospora]